MDQTVHCITMHHAMDRRLAARPEGLCKHYPHFELQDVDLAFEWGIVIGLVGPLWCRRGSVRRLLASCSLARSLCSCGGRNTMAAPRFSCLDI